MILNTAEPITPETPVLSKLERGFIMSVQQFTILYYHVKGMEVIELKTVFC